MDEHTTSVRRSAKSSFGLALFLTFASTALAQTKPAPERPRDAELRKLGETLAAFSNARAKALEVDEARVAVERTLAELRTQFPKWDPLRESADLGRAWELATRARRVEARDGEVANDTIREGSFATNGLEYAYRLPKDYDPAGRYPLVLAIPDHGEKPADHIREHWTEAALRDAAIVVAPAMPNERAEWTRVMVDGRPGGLCHALTVLRVASERFAADVDRTFVIGRGRGVPAALACGNYGPQRFAGAGGRSGDAGDQNPQNFLDLPTYFAAAGAEAAAFAEAAKAAGFDNCTVDPAGTEASLWKWMGEHPRDRAPKSVTVVPGDPFPTRAYWMRIAPSASDARATASLERDSNTVRVAANGVAAVTLLLNDGLLDLDKPVHVVCNESEQTRSVRRSLASALEMLADGTSDASCVYVATLTIDLSGREIAAAADPTKDPQFTEALTAAGADPAKLWALYQTFASDPREPRAAHVLRKLVRIAPDHEQARAALGHVRWGEAWFSTREQLERFTRGQDPATAEARGLVKQKGVWVLPEERSLLGKGLVRDRDTGTWLTAADRERLSKGWVRQDLAWIRPEEVDSFDAGLWRVDGEWLALAEANERHASLDAPWRIPTREILLTTTLDRDVALRAIEHMGRALDDLRRVFGTEPMLPLAVTLLRDQEQYDRFAFGDPDGARRATHAGRLQTIHHAFFAESWFAASEGKPEFRGQGVGYWEAHVPNGDAYGVHSARLACGLSFVEALDPSPKAVQSALASGLKSGYYEAYRAEKRLPAWLRYGGAVYAERFFRDPTTPSDGEAWWARKWSLDNLKKLGELDPLAEVFAFRLDPDKRDASRKLLLEAGLVVAFVVDGNCAPVTAAHQEFKRLLVAGRLTPKGVAGFTEAIAAHEGELRVFAAGE